MKVDFEINIKKHYRVLVVLFCSISLCFILKYGYFQYNKTQLEKYNQAKALYDQCKFMPGALIKETRSTPVFGNGIDVTCEYYSNFPIFKRP